MIQIRNTVFIAPLDSSATISEGATGNERVVDSPPSALGATALGPTANAFAHLDTPAIVARLDFFKPDPPPILSEGARAGATTLVDAIKEAEKDASATAPSSPMEGIAQAEQGAAGNASPTPMDGVVQAVQGMAGNASPSLMDGLVQAAQGMASNAPSSLLDDVMHEVQGAAGSSFGSLVSEVWQAVEQDLPAQDPHVKTPQLPGSTLHDEVQNALPRPVLADWADSSVDVAPKLRDAIKQKPILPPH